MNRKLIYFGDPMCSWCWGFAPTVRMIERTFGQDAPLSMTVGGLHVDDDSPMSDRYKATIRHHWEDVHRATGAKFDYRFFDREGFVLDTEPACRAVVTARNMGAEDLLGFYESISRCFYSENKDPTSLETFKSVAEAAGLDADAFAQTFELDEAKQATRKDFQTSRRMGVSGFPTVILREDDRHALLTAGYKPFESLRPVIEAWLENGLAERK